MKGEARVASESLPRVLPRVYKGWLLNAFQKRTENHKVFDLCTKGQYCPLLFVMFSDGGHYFALHMCISFIIE